MECELFKFELGALGGGRLDLMMRAKMAGHWMTVSSKLRPGNINLNPGLSLN